MAPSYRSCWLLAATTWLCVGGQASASSAYSASGHLVQVADLTRAGVKAGDLHITHIVAATAEVLAENLATMGWRERSYECAVDLPPVRLGDRPPDRVFES